MNIGSILKIKSAWEKFSRNHPRFSLFLDVVSRKGMQEGTVISISVTDPSGNTDATNMKITASDLELFQTLKDLKP